MQSWSLSPSYHLKPPCHLICTPPSLSPPYHLGIPSVGFHGKTMDTEADEITSFVLEPCQFCESSSSTCFPILCFVLTAIIVPILSQPHHYAKNSPSSSSSSLDTGKMQILVRNLYHQHHHRIIIIVYHHHPLSSSSLDTGQMQILVRDRRTVAVTALYQPRASFKPCTVLVLV